MPEETKTPIIPTVPKPVDTTPAQTPVVTAPVAPASRENSAADVLGKLKKRLKDIEKSIFEAPTHEIRAFLEKIKAELKALL